MTNYKSIAAHKVLEMMDEGISYEKALKKVLKADKALTKKELEKELNIYI